MVGIRPDSVKFVNTFTHEVEWVKLMSFVRPGVRVLDVTFGVCVVIQPAVVLVTEFME